MSVPFAKSTFTIGEIAPALFGRVDLARFSAAASTARNCFVKFQGGLSSRAGTKFVGFSKQTGRNYPPRLITFQFNINQGLALEFGNRYMRVIQNGAFVVEPALLMTAATQANPAQITFTAARGAASATANTGAVISSYEPGDTITLAGGNFFTQTVLSVTTTQLVGLQLNAAGSGYAATDTITLDGGTHSTAAVVTVDTVDGGGAILTFHVTTAGSYTVNPAGLAFTQASTTGGGLGATFQYAIMAPLALAVSVPGVYSSYPANSVIQESTSGTGLGCTFTVTTTSVMSLANGDWVQIDDTVGMTQLNGNTYIVANATATTVTLTDVYGNAIDSTAFGAYVSGGTLSRIYTLETPYAEQDLAYLKFVQSADVMSLCLVNQETQVEYAPQDLARLSDTNWVFEPVVAAASVDPPTTIGVVASDVGQTTYQYVVTSVDPDNGSESVASPIGEVSSAIGIAAFAGTITITWDAVDGVSEYNIYKAQPAYDSTAIPVGVQFGFAGKAFGTQFIDSNIVQDFSQVPPKHENPFARGRVSSVKVIAGGSGYTTVSVSISSTTGSGAVMRGVIVSGALVAVIIDNAGEGYVAGDTVTISGDGSGASAVATIGPQTGTYPAVPTYFQQRRGYGYTLNEPDTYFFSQPGAYKNFDTRIPTIPSDAIKGNPWSQQVNGIQSMLNRPGGLIVFTGKEAYQLTGNGGSSFNPQPITPSTQQVQPQAFNGCHDHVQPIGADSDILYLQSKGSIIRDLNYNYIMNSYTGADLTLNSSHLFTGYQILEWAWAEEPFKTVWMVRSDGVMLCLTYVKPQEVAGFTRHDTNGQFVSVCSVVEPALELSHGTLTLETDFVDAVYVATKRNPSPGAAYMIERMDDRLWSAVEDTWCVDCGLRLDQPTPDATLTVASATGAGAISSITVVDGGSGWGADTTAVVVDDNGDGPGDGCTIALTIVDGVITAAVPTGGLNYTYPQIVLDDPSNGGSGAELVAVLDNTTTAEASGNVFTNGNVGYVIRSGGGIMTVTGVSSPTEVTVNITSPIVSVTVDAAGNRTPLPQPVGHWTMTQPVSQVDGLDYLAGLVVTGTYDGKALPPQTVPASGVIVLPAPASAVTIGLGFVAQVQTPYFTEPGQHTVEGQRKKIADVVARVEASLGFTIGSNQPDGSTLSPTQVAPTWEGMQPVEKNANSFNRAPYGSDVEPLWTGDSVFIPVESGFGVPGQACVEQASPFPLNLLSLYPAVWAGDVPQSQEPRSSASMNRNA